MPIIVVEVMPKAELLDPQGKAVAGALARLGKSRFTGVRLGKRFEVTFEGEADDASLAEVRELAESILSNSVIEDVVSVRFEGGATRAAGAHAAETPVDAPGSAA
ncbi:MAG: phosphoribosylformylglycinamidine synthase subunit PurS [Burkholderiaceae bacterium]|nr:phosphoribosylformylglycinamidine synthase subunit PurS [Microbacteriaceae bacterium]